MYVGKRTEEKRREETRREEKEMKEHKLSQTLTPLGSARTP
jgi:hypothetical protein